MKKSLLVILSLVSFLLFLTVLFQLLCISVSIEQKQRYCSPNEFKYDFYDGYCVTTYKRNYLLSSQYEIFITKNGVESYGYRLTSPLGENKINVEWSAEGVTIKQDSKNEITIFVPYQNFTGGR